MSTNSRYYQRINGYFTDDELAVWRFIRDNGGYWSAPELLDRFQAFGSGRALGGVLTRLRNSHCLVLRERRTELRKYGVTGSCKAPMTESLEPQFGEPS